MEKIQDRLYLGDLISASDHSKLKSEGITHILNLSENASNKFTSEFVYKHVKMNDSERTDIKRKFPDLFMFIDCALE